jgi:hypothetical protein
MTMFDSVVAGPRPWSMKRAFTADDQWKGSGFYPAAQLVLHTQNSVYAFLIEGGGWDTPITLRYTTNATAQQWVGERVVLGKHYSVENLLTAVLYGARPVSSLDLLQQMLGKPYSFSVYDWSGMYGSDRTQLAEWLITSIRRVELQVA